MAERNFANRTLYHGDNLDSLRGMNSRSVNLIVTDPPFNKSRDFHATPDSLSSGAQFQDRWSWHDDVHGVVTPSGPAATGWWGCSRRMRKRSIGRSHRTHCRQHPLNPAGGLVDAAEGGYRVAGRWDFSSGCDPETRVMLICNLDFVHLAGVGEDVGELSVNCGWGFSAVGFQPSTMYNLVSVGDADHPDPGALRTEEKFYEITASSDC